MKLLPSVNFKFVGEACMSHKICILQQNSKAFSSRRFYMACHAVVQGKNHKQKKSPTSVVSQIERITNDVSY